MAPKGTPIKIDPNVKPLRNLLSLKDKRDNACNSQSKDRKLGTESQENCRKLKEAYNAAISNKKAAKKSAKFKK